MIRAPMTAILERRCVLSILVPTAGTNKGFSCLVPSPDGAQRLVGERGAVSGNTGHPSAAVNRPLMLPASPTGRIGSRRTARGVILAAMQSGRACKNTLVVVEDGTWSVDRIAFQLIRRGYRFVLVRPSDLALDLHSVRSAALILTTKSRWEKFKRPKPRGRRKPGGKAEALAPRGATESAVN